MNVKVCRTFLGRIGDCSCPFPDIRNHLTAKEHLALGRCVGSQPIVAGRRSSRGGRRSSGVLRSVQLHRRPTRALRRVPLLRPVVLRALRRGGAGDVRGQLLGLWALGRLSG